MCVDKIVFLLFVPNVNGHYVSEVAADITAVPVVCVPVKDDFQLSWLC